MVSLSEMVTAVIAFVVLAIVIGIGGTIMSDIGQTNCEDGGYYWNVTAPKTGACELNGSDGGALTASTIAGNATSGGLDGMQTFGEWLPTIAVIFAAALVIGIVSAYFYMRG